MKIGVLWDLDGTLLDTLQDLADAVNWALAQMGYPPRSYKEVRDFVGNGALNLLRRSVPEGTSEENVAKTLELFRDYYSKHTQVKTAPFSGVEDALSKVLEKYPCAIVSNKPDPAVKFLCKGFFPRLYALGETPGIPRKPAPDMVHFAMEQLGVERCIYVGDSEVDVQTAKNAGAPCLSVVWGFRDEDVLMAAGAKYLCREPAQIPDMIDLIAKENF